MNKNLRIRTGMVLAVLAASLFFALPLEKRVNLGLDLKGGMHLVLRVETEKLAENAKSDAVIRAIEILRNRIDSLGVGETAILRQGEDQIIVELPGVKDRDRALNMIGRVAQLEFFLVHDNSNLLQEALSGKVPEGYLLKYTKEKKEPLLIHAAAALKGEGIQDARVDVNSSGFYEPKISLTFNAKGTQEFADITRKHVGERLAIVLDGEVLSAPNINEPILSGQAEITGQFSFEEASLLALALRSGSLPAPMKVEEERTIGPLLGKDSIAAGIKATVIGGVLVIGFMLLYYWMAGFISDIALVMNIIMIFGIMGFLNVMMPGAQFTLTLPGIAGIILTLGMAVDANVLINERIREEIENGRPLAAAINNGYNRAFSAIFDSNITTLIAAFMLFQFGSGPIKGFAVTLAIGITASMFTALYVTRTILLLLIHFRSLKSLPMMKLFSNTGINFVRYSYVFMAMSAILIAVTLFLFFQKGEKAYGIDFAGGQIQEYKFQNPVTSEQIRGILKATNMSDAVIQHFSQTPENVMIRTAEESEDVYKTVQNAFQEQMPDNQAELLRIEKVGPVVGKHLRQRAVWAIVLAMAGILVYVGFRFKHFDFATAGVIALIHDVAVALGLLVLLGYQVDLLTVTALLTIAGFSINDTIVIYDRIRENIAKSRKYDLAEVINLSVNQTLSRTVLTSFTVLMVTTSLYFWGGEVLRSFALCLLIGFIAGTYSTVFIASPLVLAWQKKQKK